MSEIVEGLMQIIHLQQALLHKLIELLEMHISSNELSIYINDLNDIDERINRL